MVNRIELVQVGKIDREILSFLQVFLEESLEIPCDAGRFYVDPEDTYDLRRRQYNSTAILTRLASLSVDREVRVLGVADIDLFIPIFTFVFGEAQLGGKAALISVARLRQTFYGLPEDEPLFLKRCEKEAIHELGHVFDLVHCENFECAMYFSNTVEQVDLKQNRFCLQCRNALRFSGLSVA